MAKTILFNCLLNEKLLCSSLVAFLADSALTSLLLGSLYGSLLNTCERGVDHDATAVFTYDDFLAHLYIELTLSGNLIEATTTSIALYVYYTKAIACVLADTLK